MSGLKNRFKTKFDSVWGRNKPLEGDVYNQLEKDCENIRKAGTTIKKSLLRYVESKQSIKERLLNETKQDTTEFRLSCKIQSVVEPLTGITSQYAEVVTNTFKELGDYRHNLESFFNNKSAVQFDKHFEEPIVDIKRTAKIVNTARVNAFAIKNNKKATEEMIQQCTYVYESEKIKRQNLMLDYRENDNVARIEILLQLYEQLVKYHLECSELFKSHLDLLTGVREGAVDAGIKAPFPLPDPNSCFTLKDSISFSDDVTIEKSSPSDISSELRGNASTGLDKSQSFVNVSSSQSSMAPINNTSDLSSGVNNPFLTIEQEANAIVEDNKTNKSPNNPFLPEIKTYAIVHFDFEAECDDELTVKAGNEVLVIRNIDQDWVLAEFNGKKGYVPVTYIQIKK